MQKDGGTFTLTELAQYIGPVSTRTLRRMIKDKRFPVKPIKGTRPRRWAKEKVDQWRGVK